MAGQTVETGSLPMIDLDLIERRRRSGAFGRRLLRFARTKPLGAIGAIIIVCVLMTAALAPWIAPHDPYELRVDQTLVPPAFAKGGQEFLLGTDNYGRDLFSRVIWGAQISVYVSFSAVAIGSVLGASLGLTSSFFGGRFDLVVQRVIDAKQAIPGLVLALAMMSALGQSLNNVVIAIAVGLIATQTRVMRSAGLAIKENMYIDAARALGAPGSRILLRHMLPNCLAPYIILVSAELGGAILIEASLSFLGLGAPPPTPSWGAMLSGASQDYMRRAPWMVVFPGLAISAVVFGFNLLGDALRDVLDPRLRQG